MHLFLVRTPGLDAIAHLHPRRAGDGSFDQAVPRLPPGSYRLYGDIVHANGIDETVTTTLPLAGTGSDGKANRDRFDPDDAVAVLPAAASAQAPAFAFADGAGRLLWLDARAARAGQTIVLEIEADGADGRPLPGVEPSMGMAGHAMIIARDGSVFAHIHPTGSVPMAAMALVDGAAAMDHSHHRGMVFPPRIRFPFVFPRAGSYRIFVQVKIAGTVETAVWDVKVAG
jgi:hypothetical protein